MELVYHVGAAVKQRAGRGDGAAREDVDGAKAVKLVHKLVALV